MQKGFTSPVIIFLILLPVIGFFLGTQYKQTAKNVPDTQNKNDECSKQLAEKEEEIKLCVQDSASVGNSSKAAYAFKDFGVYSPSFEGKEIENQVYKYKRQNITRKELILEQDEQKNSTAGVIVWEYSSIDGTLAGDPNQAYVIFGGYENYGVHPTTIDPNPKDKEGYTNPKNIKMVWGYGYCPKSICRVTLSFFSKYTPSGHPIYAQIWVNNPGYLKESGLNSPGINQAKDQLKKIADALEDFSTYH